MGRRVIITLSIALLSLFAIQIEGCTVIGYGIGSSIDARSSSVVRPAEISQVITIEPGAKIVFHLSDSSTVSGTYRGLAVLPTPEYEGLYEVWRESAVLGVRPPRLHETISIRRRAETIKATFLGFGPRRVHYRSKSMKTLGWAGFDELLWIADSSGTRISDTTLIAAADRLPVHAVARVQEGKTERTVDLLDGSVLSVSAGHYHRGARTAGTIIGLTIDAGLIVAAAVAVSGSQAGCSSSYSGGPLYSPYYSFRPVSMDTVLAVRVPDGGASNP
jgi:hypothetical protein